MLSNFFLLLDRVRQSVFDKCIDQFLTRVACLFFADLVSVEIDIVRIGLHFLSYIRMCMHTRLYLGGSLNHE